MGQGRGGVEAGGVGQRLGKAKHAFETVTGRVGHARTDRIRAQMTPEQQLQSLGITLPTPTAPIAAYIPTKQVGNLLFVSGQVPFRDGKILATGPVPSAVSLETAQECA